MENLPEEIQEEIVVKNNFGDYSVCGSDLKTAATLALLFFIQSDEEKRTEIIKSIESKRKYLAEEFPNLITG
jgi:hypothetical protein